jgi:N-acetylmuramoyl-L-alanine amidase
VRLPRGLALAVSVGVIVLAAGPAPRAPSFARAAPAARPVPPSAAAPAPPARPAPRPALESAPVLRIWGVAHVGANDLARLLEATKFWRADLRKLVLRAGPHRVTLTVDNPFAVVDDRTVWLRAPVVSRRGELQVPVALLDELPRDSTLPRLIFEPRRGVVVRAPRGGLVRSPEVTAGDTLTRVVFPVERVADVTVVGRARGHFRVRFSGTFVGAAPESLPPGSLVRRILPVAAAAGSDFELDVESGAAGYRLKRVASTADAAVGTVALEFPRSWRTGLEEFALEARPSRVRVIVLDPGHGGSDAGVTVGTDVEKDLALALARLVRTELASRLRVQVVLTRDDDRPLTPEQRAEIANRARADLVVSLHFDAVPGTQRSGATAWCPPAGVGAREDPLPARAPLVLLPWREVALRRAVLSRSAAEAILAALDAAGAGPVRLRERLMVPLLGVDAAGLVLDCATLSAIPDRIRLEDPRGMKELAAAIATGVARWVEGG